MSQVEKLPKSFHRFGQLPPEIRRLIWSLTLTRPRIIDVFAFNKKLGPDEVGNPSKDDRIGILQSGIPILYVCYESRNVALEVYKDGVDTEDQTSLRFQQRRDELPRDIIDTWVAKGCHFPCRRTSQKIPGEIRPRLYLDLKKDVICLNRVWWFIGRHALYSLRNYFGRDVLTSVRYLCLPYIMFVWAAAANEVTPGSLPAGRAPSAAYSRVTLRDFPNLREILINLDPKENDGPPCDREKITVSSIFKALRHYADTSPNWRLPVFRLVEDRAGVEKLVNLGLLAK